MARFSGKDDNGGSSNSKRRRISPRRPCQGDDRRPEGAEHGFEEQEVNQVIAEEEDSGEEQLENVSRDAVVRMPSETVRGRRPAVSGIDACPAIPKGSGECSFSVSLTDPEVLDCPICLEPLSVPVYQCLNGHTACCQCCLNLKNKCPSCNLPIGYNRCRAIERVLESVQMPCPNKKHGCKSTLKFSERRDHERICDHSPFSCPCTDCSFLGSSEELSKHMLSSHPRYFRQFRYNSRYPVCINPSDQFIVLKGQDKGDLFILRNSDRPLGNMLAVSSFCSNPMKGEVSYELMFKTGDCSITLRSTTGNSFELDKDLCSSGFLLVPKCLTNPSRYLKLELQIWNKVV